jgi:hypothetical protein
MSHWILGLVTNGTMDLCAVEANADGSPKWSGSPRRVRTMNPHTSGGTYWSQSLFAIVDNTLRSGDDALSLASKCRRGGVMISVEEAKAAIAS